MSQKFIDMVASFDSMMTRVLTQINLKLNSDEVASSAMKLETARQVTISGDATGTFTFDGSANATAVLTLGGSGVTAGTYQKVTVNVKGLVTAGAALVAADIPALDTSKVTTGVFAAARIPTLNQSTTGNAATATVAARLGKNGVTAASFTVNDTPVKIDNPTYLWGSTDNVSFYPYQPSGLSVGVAADCTALKNMGRREVFITTAAPNDSLGADGDVWLTY